MMNNSFYISGLIVKKIKGSLTSDELEELESWKNESPENLLVYNKAIDTKHQLEKLDVYELFNKNKVQERLNKELFRQKSIALNTRKIIRYAAAILIPVVFISVLAYLQFNTPEVNLAELDAIVEPGKQKATLILSNGGEMQLEGKNQITEIDDGEVKIKNENNTLIYSETENKRIKQLVFNELQTPRGGGYNLTLADGTRVWLNAGSSLKFPVEFTDSTRKVYLAGEAYFEVSHNGKPFIVSSEEINVRVLGTSFNVSAYTDDSEIKTTLVEGKISVNFKVEDNRELSRIITPNEQAIVSRVNSKMEVIEVNTSQYTSWVHGKFEFNNESLDIVMKRLARWYDFSYEFKNEDARSYHFTARINNQENISTILEMLQLTTEVEFLIKENKIVVL